MIARTPSLASLAKSAKITLKSLGFAVVVASASPVAFVQADELQHLDQEVEEEVTGHHGEHGGGHGHGGPLTLEQIFTGEEKWQFWGSVVNFALLLFLVNRMAKKPLGEFLGSRREGIERGISEAAEVKKAAEEAFNTYNERMQTLDAELTKLRKDVAEAAERDRVRIVAEANEGVARLKAETDTLVQRQTEQLEAQIRREVVTAAAEAAEKAVRELTNPEDQQRLADSFMRELSKLADKSEGKRV